MLSTENSTQDQSIMLIKHQIEAPVGDVEKEERHGKRGPASLVNSLRNAASAQVSQRSRPVERSPWYLNGLNSVNYGSEKITNIS